MARITCKTPSTGKRLPLRSVNLPTSATTIAEAPDFSVPDTAVTFAERDPLDDNRAIRPGEVFFRTPVYARNKSGSTATVTVQILTEAAVTVSVAVVTVPPGETVAVPVQGLSLMKRDPDAATGDRLRMLASAADTFDVFGAADELLSAEHIGVVA